MTGPPTPEQPRESYLLPGILMIATLLLLCGGVVFYRKLDRPTRAEMERQIAADTQAELLRLRLETQFAHEGLAEYEAMTGWDLDTLETELPRLKEECGGGDDIKTCADILAAWRARCQALEKPTIPEPEGDGQ